MSGSQFPPPPAPFPQDQYPDSTQPVPRSGMATTAMALGIIGLLCAPLGIVALILGIVSLVAINKNPLQKSGKGFALTGIILGAVSIVVMPVIALMVAILIPSLGRARELANRSVCAANLRGIAQSLNVYAADNNDAYPIVARSGRYGLAGSAGPNVTQNMFLLVSGGLVDPKQFVCKSDPAPVSPAPSTLGADFATDMNYSYSFAYPWTTAASATTPANTVGSWWRNQTDASLPLMSDMAPLNGAGSPPANTPAGGRLANSFNHGRQGENVGYGDAHVEFARSPDVGQNNDNIFTTNDGVPSPVGMPFPGGVAPAIGPGGTPGMYDICLVPAADASSGYARK